MEWKYNENRTQIILNEVPKRKKKITGTRFSSVIGLNKYQTSFGAWCEITGLATLPFEDSQYTLAGKAIEPKQIKYIAEKFDNVMDPKEYFGNIYETMKYDFYKEIKIFGGMWDAVATKNDKKTIAITMECKTSSHPEDWENNIVPPNYLCQGMLYSKLNGVKKIIFCASFLKSMDYAKPEEFKVTEENTKYVLKDLDRTTININGVENNIDMLMDKAKEFWESHVLTGISPEFDEVKDKEYLDIIRANNKINDETLENLCEQSYNLYLEIDKLKKETKIAEMEKKLKKLESQIKNKIIENIEIDSKNNSCGDYTLKVTKETKFNEKQFQLDKPGIYNQYVYEEDSYTLSKTRIGKEK